MRVIFAVICALALLASCGSSKPTISQPAEGQTFSLGGQAPISFYVTMENDDYDGVTIAIRGDIPTGEITCSGGQGTMMVCQSAYGQAQQSNNCPVSCTAIIVATKGDQTDFRTIKFVRNGAR